MSKRAEDYALKVYPKIPDYTGIRFEVYRGLMIQAYEQAEKDLALTADDIRQIVKINYEIIFQDTTGIKCKDVAEETLRRFNQWREKK